MADQKLEIPGEEARKTPTFWSRVGNFFKNVGAFLWRHKSKLFGLLTFGLLLVLGFTTPVGPWLVAFLFSAAFSGWMLALSAASVAMTVSLLVRAVSAISNNKERGKMVRFAERHPILAVFLGLAVFTFIATGIANIVLFAVKGVSLLALVAGHVPFLQTAASTLAKLGPGLQVVLEGLMFAVAVLVVPAFYAIKKGFVYLVDSVLGRGRENPPSPEKKKVVTLKDSSPRELPAIVPKGRKNSKLSIVDRQKSENLPVVPKGNSAPEQGKKTKQVTMKVTRERGRNPPSPPPKKKVATLEHSLRKEVPAVDPKKEGKNSKPLAAQVQ